jgi:hypothetical protein
VSVLVRYQEVGMTREQYDEAGRLLEQGDFPPSGLECPVLHGDDGSLRVSELWASADQQRAFNDGVLLPVLNRSASNSVARPRLFRFTSCSSSRRAVAAREW